MCQNVGFVQYVSREVSFITDSEVYLHSLPCETMSGGVGRAARWGGGVRKIRENHSGAIHKTKGIVVFALGVYNEDSKAKIMAYFRYRLTPLPQDECRSGACGPVPSSCLWRRETPVSFGSQVSIVTTLRLLGRHPHHLHTSLIHSLKH